jgi:hypothetical protein
MLKVIANKGVFLKIQDALRRRGRITNATTLRYSQMIAKISGYSSHAATAVSDMGME